MVADGSDAFVKVSHRALHATGNILIMMPFSMFFCVGNKSEIVLKLSPAVMTTQ